jgi:hypothetical protein
MPALTASLYERVRRRLAEMGHGGDYVWSQGLKPPDTAEALVGEYVWVVLNSGMKNTIARQIMDRVWPVLVAGGDVHDVFGHRAKASAIECGWASRELHYQSFLAADSGGPEEVLRWCESLPWIGRITKYHLAKNLGCDVAKPDRWLERLASAESTTTASMCSRLAYETGDRVATVDVVLWRACAVGVLTVKDGVIEAPGLEIV